jgi:hypothetical protein
MTEQNLLSEKNSLSIGDLTIEDNTDRVSLYGSLNLSRDQLGLKQAKALRDILDQVISSLEAQKDLPEQLAVLQPKTVKNPFG